jgi:prolyl oligopeptidase
LTNDIFFNEKDIQDFHLDLEKIDDIAALEWVHKKNGVAIARLMDDPRYAVFDTLLREEAAHSDRIAYPNFERRGRISNYWTDDVNLRGIWREADRTRYLEGNPDWQIVLDIDALAKREGRNWVYAGGQSLPSNPDRYLLLFSEGGKDAVTVREFDVRSRMFVPGGFELPEAKQLVSWVDLDTIYVSREWQKGDVTASGYPYITKVLNRGQPLDEAKEVFRGQKTDIGADAAILFDDDRRPVVQLNSRLLSGEEILMEFVRDGLRAVFPLPTTTHFVCYFSGQMVFQLKDSWASASGQHYLAESLISFDLLANMARPEGIEPTLIFSPRSHQVISGVERTKNRLLVEVLSNVAGEIHAFCFDSGGWQAKQFALPQNASISVYSADDESDALFLTIEGFVRPTELYWADAVTMETKLLQTEPAHFDADSMEVAQHWVESKDGTRVPYFMVSRKDLPLDGSNPTLIYAYGGFEALELPHYLGIFGKIWLEKGGVYVLPNIRGGGEFGAQWHRAGLKTHRQRIYDDFQAVAEDLIARKITSPEKLGISGGSNGGLLMGVQLVQRPDLWSAVVISVPLLDMMRYNILSAGASWMSEYGDPADPVEGAFLRSISPYHNLKPGLSYPEPLILTSRADDRVHPGHARKMAAKMDDMGLHNLFFESDEGGHGGAKTSWDEPDSDVMKYVYLVQKLMD